MLDLVRQYCKEIKNGRNLFDIHNHLHLEVEELDEEVYDMGYPGPGEDGIVGESVDVILCAMDMIFTHSPDITNEELEALFSKKLEKWKRNYSDKINK
jgi:hypothetical protein